MVTAKFTGKLKLIWAIIRSYQFFMVYYHKEEAKAVGAGKTDLAGMMAICVELMRASKSMVDAIEGIATEQGELQSYLALKKTLEGIHAGDERG